MNAFHSIVSQLATLNHIVAEIEGLDCNLLHKLYEMDAKNYTKPLEEKEQRDIVIPLNSVSIAAKETEVLLVHMTL